MKNIYLMDFTQYSDLHAILASKAIRIYNAKYYQAEDFRQDILLIVTDDRLENLNHMRNMCYIFGLFLDEKCIRFQIRLRGYYVLIFNAGYLYRELYINFFDMNDIQRLLNELKLII